MDATWATHVGFVVLALAVILQVVSGLLQLRRRNATIPPPPRLKMSSEIDSGAIHEVMEARLEALEKRVLTLELKNVRTNK